MRSATYLQHICSNSRVPQQTSPKEREREIDLAHDATAEAPENDGARVSVVVVVVVSVERRLFVVHIRAINVHARAVNRLIATRLARWWFIEL